ncbi:MAG: stage III sporulation protein AG [Lachnospiraceae bacterium]
MNNLWKKKKQLLLVLLCGILLVVIALPQSKPNHHVEEIKDSELSQSNSNETYLLSLEKRLAKRLGEVQGVGTLKVMITLKSSTEKIIEKDREESKESTRETTVYDSTEQNSQTPYISKEISPEIEGVLVVADGGDNPIVIQEITEAVQALFDVDTHKIKIMKKNKQS